MTDKNKDGDRIAVRIENTGSGKISDIRFKDSSFKDFDRAFDISASDGKIEGISAENTNVEAPVPGPKEPKTWDETAMGKVAIGLLILLIGTVIVAGARYYLL